MITVNLPQPQESIAKDARNAPHGHVQSATWRKTSSAYWMRRWTKLWDKHHEDIIDSTVVVLLFAALIGAWYIGMIYGSSL